MRLAAAIALALLLIVVREISFLPDGRLYVHFFDVGQGDAMLIVTPTGKTVLIDGGPDHTILEHLGRHLSFFRRTIDLVVLTHPDSDHVTGLAEVLQRYSVQRILLTGSDGTLGHYRSLLATVENRSTPILLPTFSEDLLLDAGVVLDVVWPHENEASLSRNNGSIVLRFLYRGSPVALFSGDIERSAEWSILASGADIQAPILKVPHHGSKTSSTVPFLRAVAPKNAIISAGKPSPYGHPHEDVLVRLQDHGITTIDTPWSVAVREPCRAYPRCEDHRPSMTDRDQSRVASHADQQQ